MTESEALQRDDAGIERAAVALCFANRPVLTIGPVSQIDALAWWRLQSEVDRRRYLYQARVTIAAWELYWKTETEGYANAAE